MIIRLQARISILGFDRNALKTTVTVSRKLEPLVPNRLQIWIPQKPLEMMSSSEFFCEKLFPSVIIGTLSVNHV